jgi:hypothetical protein
VALLVAAFMAIIVNAPSRIAKINPATLVDLMQEPHWSVSGAIAQNEIARRQLTVLISSGFQNRLKAWLLTLSICAQILGISLIALAELKILLSNS